MKIKFKEQGFQLEAVRAVIDCFEGQKLRSNHFTLQRSADLVKRAKQEAQKAIQSSFSDKFSKILAIATALYRLLLIKF